VTQSNLNVGFLVAAALLAQWLGPATAQQAAVAATSTTRTAVFAGGCFWCMEKPFDALPGVTSTTAGYSGGRTVNPSYEEVSSGGTGHIEVVQITYDAARVSYAKLLDVFWRNVDPFDGGGQFCDRGSQYRAAVFVANEEERRAAAASKLALEQRFGRKLATTIESAAPFYAAEDYHQNYYEKNPLRYRYYRGGCGRDRRLEAVWGAEARGENPKVAPAGAKP
jgi:peptide-methionine (S)-S-oxide reductase